MPSRRAEERRRLATNCALHAHNEDDNAAENGNAMRNGGLGIGDWGTGTEDRRLKTNGSRRPGIDLRLLRNIHYSKFVSGNRGKEGPVYWVGVLVKRKMNVPHHSLSFLLSLSHCLVLSLSLPLCWHDLPCPMRATFCTIFLTFYAKLSSMLLCIMRV